MTTGAPCRYKDKCPRSAAGIVDTGAARPKLYSVSKYFDPAGEATTKPSYGYAAGAERWKRKADEAHRYAKKLGSSFEPHYPSHVRACANNSLPHPPWFLSTWKRGAPGRQTRSIYTCNSSRCPSPQCQKAAASRDFSRISAALNQPQFDTRSWVFLVLTIDQRDTFGKLVKPYRDEQDAYKRLGLNTRLFLRRLRKHQKRQGWRVLANEWTSTVEVQRNGFPHMNMIVYSPELAKELREKQAIGPHPNNRRRHRAQVDGWLLEMITATNWGTISTAEACRNADSLAGYVVKLSGDLERTSGEISKITQAPTNAKMKLRRVRAGRGFLPAKAKKEGPLLEQRTGVMMKRQKAFGVMTASPMLEPDMVKPVGESEEEQAAQYELYRQGVMKALQVERDALKVEEEERAMLKADPSLLPLLQTRRRERELALRPERPVIHKTKLSFLAKTAS